VSDSTACIIAVGETDYCRAPGSGMSNLGLILLASRRAADEIGLDIRLIDGVIAPYINATVEEIKDNLGLHQVNFSGQVNMGGASPVASLLSASTAVGSGAADIVLVATGWNGYSGTRTKDASMSAPVTTFRRTVRDYYAPYGVVAPAQVYALMASRHMMEFGTTHRDLAAVAIACRKHAQHNPRALMRGRPMDLDDYLRSPWVTEPYRRHDCCLETDAAAAVLVSTLKTARRLGVHHPVVVAAVAEGRATPASDIVNREDLFHIGLTDAAPRAYTAAGLGPEEVNFAQVYDCFTFEVIQQLEEAGFCRRGEGGHFVRGGRIEVGGTLPVNTHGGLLSQAHALGMNHVVEGVRQLRGTGGATQVEGARAGVVTGWGDMGDGSIAVLRQP
jgi:acetyl-CoA acetyltransferase